MQDRRNGLPIRQMLCPTRYFFPGHGFLLVRMAPCAVAMLISNNRSNVHGFAGGTLNRLDSERRPSRNDSPVMLERWKNQQALNISTKAGARCSQGLVSRGIGN
jgi:hypothetical protein